MGGISGMAEGQNIRRRENEDRKRRQREEQQRQIMAYMQFFQQMQAQQQQQAEAEKRRQFQAQMAQQGQQFEKQQQQALFQQQSDILKQSQSGETDQWAGIVDTFAKMGQQSDQQQQPQQPEQPGGAAMPPPTSGPPTGPERPQQPAGPVPPEVEIQQINDQIRQSTANVPLDFTRLKARYLQMAKEINDQAGTLRPKYRAGALKTIAGQLASLAQREQEYQQQQAQQEQVPDWEIPLPDGSTMKVPQHKDPKTGAIVVDRGKALIANTVATKTLDAWLERQKAPKTPTTKPADELIPFRKTEIINKLGQKDEQAAQALAQTWLGVQTVDQLPPGLWEQWLEKAREQVRYNNQSAQAQYGGTAQVGQRPTTKPAAPAGPPATGAPMPTSPEPSPLNLQTREGQDAWETSNAPTMSRKDLLTNELLGLMRRYPKGTPAPSDVMARVLEIKRELGI